MVVLVVVVGTAELVTGATTGDAIGDGATGELPGELTGVVLTVGDADGVHVINTVGALVGINTSGACTAAFGMVTARLVEIELTVVGLAKRASRDDVLPALGGVTTSYATCTPTTVACNNSLLRRDAVTVPSDQNSFTEVIFTWLSAGNTDMIDAVKAVWNSGVLAVTPKMVCCTKTGRFVGRDVGCCNTTKTKWEKEKEKEKGSS